MDVPERTARRAVHRCRDAARKRKARPRRRAQSCRDVSHYNDAQHAVLAALERVVLGWLHCGCTALQPAVLPCNMAFGAAPCRIGVMGTQGVRHGGTQRDTQRGTQARMGAAPLSRWLVEQITSASSGGRAASACAPPARALQALAAAAQEAQVRAGARYTACTGWRSARVLRGDARAQRGGRVRMGWGGEGGRRPTGSQRSARLAVSAAGASAACSMRCMCASPNMLRLHSTAAGSQREGRREAQRASLHRARRWVRPDVHQVHQNLLAQVEP